MTGVLVTVTKKTLFMKVWTSGTCAAALCQKEEAFFSPSTVRKRIRANILLRFSRLTGLPLLRTVKAKSQALPIFGGGRQHHWLMDSVFFITVTSAPVI